MWKLVCIYFISGFAAIAAYEASYDVVFERLERVMVDKTYFDPGTVKVTRINRTHTVISGEFEVMQEVDDNVTVTFLLYEKSSGTEYRRSAAFSIIKQPICTFLESNLYLVEDFKKNTNLPDNCPIQPGKYFVKNHLVDPDKFPPYIPTSSWRGDVFIYRVDITWIHLQAFCRVDHKGYNA